MSELNIVISRPPIRTRPSETGVALLISIFVLLLVCVVAIALIVSSGTESALSGNYRSATSVYYAALAGLEEARGRLLPKNPDYFLNYKANFVPAPGVVMPLGYVSYVLNPVGAESITPWISGSTYEDKEYATEFGGASPPTSSPQMQWINSVSGSNASSVQGPLYKWVRINPVTEKSLGIDVDNNHPGNLDNSIPVYYDGSRLNLLSVGAQIYSITAYAVLPNGASKILQYTVAPNSVTLPPFPAAVTIVGNNVDFTGPNSPTWLVNGNDTLSPPGSSCIPGATPVYAVGYTNSADTSRANIDQGTFTPSRYIGQGAAPSLSFVGGSIPMNFQTEAGLNAIAQNIIQDQLYDKLINGNATGADLPSGMSPSNLMTIVVQGNLDLQNSFHSTGYGLLIVTGNFNYDPDSSWYGIILVIGQGTMTAYHGLGSDPGKIVGALLAAKTVGAPIAGMPGTSLPASSDYNVELPDTVGSTMGGTGIYYSSCWSKAALPTGSYHVLSFHEITQ